MKKLIEALHVIQEECKKHTTLCSDCPMWSNKNSHCCVRETTPDLWKINDEVQKALL